MLKKSLLSISLLLFATVGVFAQLNFEYSDTIMLDTTVYDTNEIIILKGYYQNTSPTDTIQITWRSYLQSISTGWSASICDKYGWYNIFSTTLNLNMLEPNERRHIAVSYHHFLRTGSAHVRTSVFIGNDSMVSDFIVNIVGVPPSPAPTSLEDVPTKQAEFAAYPNPSSDYFYFDLIDDISKGSLELYNSAGSLILKKEVTRKEDAFINLANISEGVYLVKYRTINNQTIHSTLVEKIN